MRTIGDVGAEINKPVISLMSRATFLITNRCESVRFYSFIAIAYLHFVRARLYTIRVCRVAESCHIADLPPVLIILYAQTKPMMTSFAMSSGTNFIYRFFMCVRKLLAHGSSFHLHLPTPLSHTSLTPLSRSTCNMRVYHPL